MGARVPARPGHLPVPITLSQFGPGRGQLLLGQHDLRPGRRTAIDRTAGLSRQPRLTTCCQFRLRSLSLLPLRLQIGQRRRNPTRPRRPAIPRTVFGSLAAGGRWLLGRHLITPAVAEPGILCRVLGGMPGRGLPSLMPGLLPLRLPLPLGPRCLPQPLLGPIRIRRGRGGDLGAIQRHHPHLAQTQPAAQHQYLREQLLHRCSEPLPEPGNRHMIRHITGTNRPKRQIPAAQPLNRPRRPHPVQPPPHQQHQQHIRVIAFSARASKTPTLMKRRRVQMLLDNLNHQPHRIRGRQPLPHIRRQ
jgi:hypothetical protein